MVDKNSIYFFSAEGICNSEFPFGFTHEHCLYYIPFVNTIRILIFIHEVGHTLTSSVSIWVIRSHLRLIWDVTAVSNQIFPQQHNSGPPGTQLKEEQ